MVAGGWVGKGKSENSSNLSGCFAMMFDIVKLGEVTSIKGGKRLPRGHQYASGITEYPYLRVCDFKDGTIAPSNLCYLSTDTQKQIRRYTISNEDVYISIAGTIGLVGIVPDSLAGANLTENAAKIVINEKGSLNRDYLVWYLRTVGQISINQKKKVTSQPKLALFRIEEISIPLPPLETQKRIVDFLDRAQALIDKRKEQLVLMDELVQSLFYDIFGDSVKNSMGWEMKTLGEVANKITDGTHKTPRYTDNGIVFLSAKNVKNNCLSTESVKYISLSEHQELTKRCKPVYGDILITKSGSTGSAAFIDVSFEFSIFESLALVKYDRNLINGYFLKYQLNDVGTARQYAKFSKGGTIKHLHLNELRKLALAIPPIDLQNVFAEKVQKIEVQKEAMKVSLGELEDNFNSLMQRAFKGKLVH